MKVRPGTSETPPSWRGRPDLVEDRQLEPAVVAADSRSSRGRVEMPVARPGPAPSTSGGSKSATARPRPRAWRPGPLDERSNSGWRRTSKKLSANRRFAARSAANVARSPSAPSNRPASRMPVGRHLPQVGVVAAAVAGQMRIAGEPRARVRQLRDRRQVASRPPAPRVASWRSHQKQSRPRYRRGPRPQWPTDSTTDRAGRLELLGELDAGLPGPDRRGRRPAAASSGFR